MGLVLCFISFVFLVYSLDFCVRLDLQKNEITEIMPNSSYGHKIEPLLLSDCFGTKSNSNRGVIL